MIRLFRLTLLVLALGVWQPAGAAEQWSEPIYNPASKSYFQLVSTGGAQTGISWAKAQARAQDKAFKGVVGRLAVVDSQETHVFIRDHFDVTHPTWIGLRYWCAFHKLQWVTGNVQSFTAFSYWAPQWYRNESTKCGIGGSSYMPVYYLPKTQGLAWQASGAPKYFEHYLVEFPTGKP